MKRTTIAQSLLQAIGHMLLAAAVGLIALPLVFSGWSDVRGAPAWLWLAASALVGAWLVLPGPVLARELARTLTRLPGQPPPPVGARPSTLSVSQRLLAVGYVVLVQAIMRRPLVLALGPTSEPLVVEAIFAIIALLVLLVVLALLHQVGKPLVEGLVAFGLDAIVATTGSDVPDPAPRARWVASPAATGPATVQAPAETVARQTLAARTQSAVTRPGGQRGSVA
ncbi:MAG: hypothetical protein ACR2IK_16320 [Chloroflexota bacterium]